MRTVIQRVSEAAVRVPAEDYEATIGHGLLVLAAFIDDVNGEVMAVSQFTLYASTVKGNRPAYIKAAKPDVAIPLYERFLQLLEQHLGTPVARGIFGADMKVSLVNDGPVTIIVDSKLKF